MNTAANLELQPWLTQSGADINPVAAKSFTAALIPGDVLEVINESTLAMGGALVTCKPPSLLPANTLANPYFGLDLEVYVPPASMANLARLELDVKRVIVDAKGQTIANVADGSTEMNYSTGFWQIDKAGGGWVNTAFTPLLPSCWTQLSFRYWMSADRYSVLSTNWGGMAYPVPATMQNLPLLESNWASVVAVQIQFEVFQPGTIALYFRDINLSVSAEPF